MWMEVPPAQRPGKNPGFFIIYLIKHLIDDLMYRPELYNKISLS